jgi:hypothetical protein
MFRNIDTADDNNTVDNMTMVELETRFDEDVTTSTISIRERSRDKFFTSEIINL